MRAHSLFSLLVAAAALAGCDDPNELPDATNENVVDTVTIAALTGTPLSQPSAYSVSESRAIRTDQSSAFDFAYDDVTGGPRFYPPGALGIGGGGTQAGLLEWDQPFAELEIAPQNGYVTDAGVPIDVGTVLAVRSRPVCTGLGGVPLYGKLEILEFDDAARTVTFQVLTNNNCGYRRLEPGIPDE